MPDDRRPMEVRALEAARGRPRTRPSRPDRPPRSRSARRTPAASRSRAARATAMAPIPSGPEQPLLGRGWRRRPRRVASTSTGIAPALWAPSTTTSAPRAWASSAISATGRTAPVAHSTWRERHDARPVVDGRVEGGDDRIPIAADADVDELDVDPEPVSQVVQRARAARMLEAGRDGPVAGPPVDRPDPDVHAIARGMGQSDVVGIGHEDRGDRGRASAIRWTSSRK